ncbi:hypothetical protein HDU93_008887 [Gonapodya sp. JEL0774]|nr:hypothetical protein HDU93_008887 [Gonapodya sp. JEL0774]
MERIEKDLEQWRACCMELRKGTGAPLAELMVCYHGVQAILHGPTASITSLATDLLIPSGLELHRQRVHVVPNIAIKDALTNWCGSAAFLLSINHAIEATESLKAADKSLNYAGNSPFLSFCLCQISLILLFAMFQLQVSGMFLGDLQDRVVAIIGRMTQLAHHSGLGVAHAGTRLAESLLTELQTGQKYAQAAKQGSVCVCEDLRNLSQLAMILWDVAMAQGAVQQ